MFQPGQKIQNWWRKYVTGQTLPELKEAIQAARIENDAPAFDVARFEGHYDQIQASGIPAPDRLVAPSWITSEAGLRLHDRADWQQTDARIRIFAAKLVETMRRANIPLYVHSAFRTQQEQDALQRAGRSRTSWPRAAHCQGKAVDIVHSRFHWQLTRDEWAFIGKVGKDLAKRLGLKVEWGGDWNFYDPAHWQIEGWENEPIYEAKAEKPIRKTPRKILRENRVS